jgi:hypothetical protein
MRRVHANMIVILYLDNGSEKHKIFAAPTLLHNDYYPLVKNRDYLKHFNYLYNRYVNNPNYSLFIADVQSQMVKGDK